MIWVVDHLLDLEADFRAIYHLTPDQALQLSGPVFLGLAYRLTAYQGVMAAKAQAEEEKRKGKTPAHRETVEVDSTNATALAVSPLGDLIEHTQV